MEGDKEIEKIIYTDGSYSLFDDYGEEHLFNPDGQEIPLEDDPEWEDDMDQEEEEDLEDMNDCAQSMTCLEHEPEEPTPEPMGRKRRPLKD